MTSCFKPKAENIYPKVTTIPITKISEESAESGGNISNPYRTIEYRGVLWSTGPNPSTWEGKTSDGTGDGTFSSKLTLYFPGTTYYVRAYADNGSAVGLGNILKFRTKGNPGDTVTDLDGNVYHTVVIGSQTWMVENLKTTKFRNGDPIDFIPNGDQWSNLTKSAYCNIFGDNNISYTYGRMYNGYAINDVRSIAPVNWHIPTLSEWDTLISFLGGNKIAGGKLKDSTMLFWQTPNTGATNEAHFFALPSGGRNAGYNGRYDGQFMFGHLWTCTDTHPCKWVIDLYYDSQEVGKQYLGLQNGFCVRCIKNK